MSERCGEGRRFDPGVDQDGFFFSSSSPRSFWFFSLPFPVIWNLQYTPGIYISFSVRKRRGENKVILQFVFMRFEQTGSGQQREIYLLHFLFSCSFFLKKGERRKRSQPIGWSAWANNPAAESTSASVDRGTLGLGTPLAGLIHMLQSTEQAMRDTHTHTKKGE